MFLSGSLGGLIKHKKKITPDQWIKTMLEKKGRGEEERARKRRGRKGKKRKEED